MLFARVVDSAHNEMHSVSQMHKTIAYAHKYADT